MFKTITTAVPSISFSMEFHICITIATLTCEYMSKLITRTCIICFCLCKRMRRHISFLPANCTVFPVVCLIICRSPYMCMFYCVSSIYCCRAPPPPKIRTTRLNISPAAVSRLLIFISSTSFYIFSQASV